MVHRLPARIKRVWCLQYTLFIIGGVIAAVAAWLLAQGHPKIRLAIWGLLALWLIYTIGRLVLIPYHYHFWRYRIGADFVEIQHGFIMRVHESIPIIKIQNISLDQGPLLRWQHLEDVTIQTASSSHTIEGLEIKEAEGLRDQLISLNKQEVLAHENQ